MRTRRFIAVVLVCLMAFGGHLTVFAQPANAEPPPPMRISDMNQIRHSLSGNFLLTQDVWLGSADLYALVHRPADTPGVADLPTHFPEPGGAEITLPVGFPTHITTHADITSWEPIGTLAAPFTGIFDGGGNTITVLIVSEDDYQGIFGVISGATIRNVTIRAHIIGRNHVGAVAGRAVNNSLIQDVVVHGSSHIVGSRDVGGLVGSATGTAGPLVRPYTIFRNCVNNGRVTFARPTGNRSDPDGWRGGGIVGNAHRGVLIEDTHNTGLVSFYNFNQARGASHGEAMQVGGLVGLAGNNLGPPGRANITVSRSSNTGDVFGTAGVGGLIGSMVGGDLLVSESFNTGHVTAFRGAVGGIAGGVREGGVIRDSYNMGSVTATGVSRGAVGGNVAGGIAGDVMPGIISHTYNTGDVSAILAPISGSGNLGGRNVGGIVGYAHNSMRYIQNNVVLSNRIDGAYEEIQGQPTVNLITGGSRRAIRDDVNNHAIQDIRGESNRDDAQSTRPLSEFFNQSVWEDLGFDFDTVWYLPEGRASLPMLQWQTKHIPFMVIPTTEDERELLIIENAQMLYDNIQHRYTDIAGFVNVHTTHIDARLSDMKSNSSAVNWVNTSLNVASTVATAVIATALPAAKVATPVQTAIGHAITGSQLGVQEARRHTQNLPSIEAFVRGEAIGGYELADSSLDIILELGTGFERNRDRVTSYPDAIQFIQAYQYIQTGIATLNMGNLFFAEQLRRSGAELVLSALLDTVVGTLANLVANFVPVHETIDPMNAAMLADLADSLKDEIVALVIAFECPILLAWSQRIDEINSRTEMLLPTVVR